MCGVNVAGGDGAQLGLGVNRPLRRRAAVRAAACLGVPLKAEILLKQLRHGVEKLYKLAFRGGRQIVMRHIPEIGAVQE